MAATLAQLKAVSKPLVVTYEGLTINIRYSPGKYTPNFETTLNSDDTNRAQFLPGLLTELVTDWDLLQDDGQTKADITPQVLSGLGYDVLNLMSTSIIKDLAPGEGNAPSSGSF